MSLITSPMKAPHKSIDLETFKDYPVWVSPKYDGLRCLTSAGGQATSSSNKLFPNRYLNATFNALGLPDDMDGELVLIKDSGAEDDGMPDTFNKTQSAIMSIEGEPKWAYFVFDLITDSLQHTFDVRFDRLLQYFSKHGCFIQPHVYLCNQHLCDNKAQLDSWMLHYQDFEGLMLRQPGAPYKCGRVTAREGYIRKYKPYVQSTAIIAGMTELMHNDNPMSLTDAGKMQRSKCQAGLRPSGMMGTLICTDPKHPEFGQFEIGTGFSQQQRIDFWLNYHKLDQGYLKLAFKPIKYKYQKFGMKDKPREPVFLGFL